MTNKILEKNYNNLKKILEKNRIIYFIDNKIKINSSSKTDARNKLKKKYLNKNINKIIRLEFSFHGGKKFYQGGKVMIDIKNYIIENKKLKLIKNDGMYGILWIPDKYFINNKINKKNFFNDVIKMIKNVKVKKNIKFPGINLFTDYI